MNTLHAITSSSVAALLAASSAAHAQSNVSISGFLDLAVSSKSGQSTQLGSLGRNNIAFAGEEDLGGGLKATFRLSMRFEMDTGQLETAPVGQRQFWQDESTVGLKGSFGSVRVGRALAPLNNNNWLYDPWYAFDRVASPMFRMTGPDFLISPGNVASPTGVDLDYTRLSNAVFYESPVFSGFQLVLNSSIEKGVGDLQNGRAVALKYNQGDFGAIVDFEQNSQRDKLVFIAASYKLGDLGIMGSYNHTKLNPNGSVYGAGWTNWAAASDPTTKRTSLTLGATYPVGPGTVRVGFGRDFQGSTNNFNYIGSSFIKAGTNYSGATNFYSLGYSYPLSKRTTVNASVARESWKFVDDDGRTSATGIALGMTHAF